MQSDDVFRRNIADATARIAAWARGKANCADIKITHTPAYWRLTSKPHVRGAAAFDLLVRSDQMYDVMIAGEIYEDRLIEDAGLFLQIVSAVSEGRLERMLVSSSLTGALQFIETIVHLDGGAKWSGTRTLVADSVKAPGDSLQAQTRRYLPYRR